MTPERPARRNLRDMTLDWSANGVPWDDASHDREMAKAWRDNERLLRPPRSVAVTPKGYDDDLEWRVRELMITDLDPDRGWQLFLTLLTLAEDDEDLTAVTIRLLEPFINGHHATFLTRAANQYETNVQFRAALAGSIIPWPGLGPSAGEPD